jgi:hypothetical protein
MKVFTILCALTLTMLALILGKWLIVVAVAAYQKPTMLYPIGAAVVFFIVSYLVLTRKFNG